MPDAPRIVVTLTAARRSHDPALGARRKGRYLDAVRRAGGEPIPLDETSGPTERAAAFAAMDGLLLSGGADIDPALYGATPDGTGEVRRERDVLERTAWDEAGRRGVPVLGICRGFQAINVFMGGRLVQHIDGHQGPGYLEGPPAIHPLRVAPDSRLAGILGADGAMSVNSYHHQAVRHADLAPGLVASAHAPHGSGELVEALESPDGRWVVAVQCHPERTESTPAAFERLFAAFVEAARGA